MKLKTHKQFNLACDILRDQCGFRYNEVPGIARQLFKEVKKPNADYNDVLLYLVALKHYEEYTSTKASPEEYELIRIMAIPLEDAHVDEWRIRVYLYRNYIKQKEV